MEIKAGKLLSIESGEYSDYGVAGFFVALKDFDPSIELEEFLNEHPEQQEDYRGEKSMFIAWMIRRGCLLDVDYTPVHIGSYSCLKIS